MIEFDRFRLDNGLRVFVHRDETTPLAVLNLMYDVGSRDEHPERTGFAHLFEHLMFSGSKNVPSPDRPLQKVGGESNAFTSTDLTNYYMTLPAENLETAFWLESDRMLSLAFSPEGLEVQRKVVVEEFKQRYLNRPYGDTWLKMRPLAYQKHPYRWATIGKEVRHIEEASMEEVKDFFFRFYRPNNAILVVAGNVTSDQVRQLSQKWFGPIPAGDVPERKLPEEPAQTAARQTEAFGDVSLEQLTLAFPMVAHQHPDYVATDLLSDVLGGDSSSILYRKLVTEREIFQTIDAYITGSIDPGLFMISGRVRETVSLEAAHEALLETLREVQTTPLPKPYLEKVKNQAEATITFSEVNLLNRALQIAYGALLGNPNLVNEQQKQIRGVHLTQVTRLAREVLAPKRSNTLFYRRQNKA